MELVACVGQDKEAWGQILGLINHGVWDKVIIIRSDKADDFPKVDNAVEIQSDSSLSLLDLKSFLVNSLKPILSDFDACVSLASGSGKEHMALISALLTIPTGIRLVAFTKKGIEFIN